MGTSSAEAPGRRLSAPDLAYVLPRAAIAFVFAGFGIWEIASPHYWTAYVPAPLAHLSWTLRLVQLHGVVLVGTATAVLLRRYARYGALLAVLLLAEICLDVLVSNGVTSVLLRDVGLLVVAGAIYWLPYDAPGTSGSA